MSMNICITTYWESGVTGGQQTNIWRPRENRYLLQCQSRVSTGTLWQDGEGDVALPQRGGLMRASMTAIQRLPRLRFSPFLVVILRPRMVRTWYLLWSKLTLIGLPVYIFVSQQTYLIKGCYKKNVMYTVHPTELAQLYIVHYVFFVTSFISYDLRSKS